MENLKTIQQLIDKKAENRLIKDLDEMRSKIFSIKVLTGSTANSFPKISFKEKETHPYWFFNSGNDTLYDALYQYWLPIYKSQEAENFLAEVERLKSDVGDLLNVNSERDY